jgi:hydroxymethylglutaryl-CoA synthase
MSIKVGIDAIGFYTPRTYISLEQLALHRGVPPEKYLKGLGQYKMSVPTSLEDVVTMGANAADRIVNKENINEIDLLLFATESAIDQSKSAGIYVHGLLGLSANCRVIELKQACYSGAFGLQVALSFIKTGQAKKALLIASDIARYGLNTPGESSQGAGAVALIISENPSLVQIDDVNVFHTIDTMDFFRPNYSTEAIVDGRYSCELYLTLFKKTWIDFQNKTNYKAKDIDVFCCHVPLPRLVEKAYLQIEKDFEADLLDSLLSYNRQVGNCYTGSLFISLCSLLDLSVKDRSHERIVFYSYGSGAIAELFTGVVQPNYQNHLCRQDHKIALFDRLELTPTEYEECFNHHYPTDGKEHSFYTKYPTGRFILSGVKNHQRCYQDRYDQRTFAAKFEEKSKEVIN